MIFRRLTENQRCALAFLRRELSDGKKHPFAEVKLKAEAEKISYRSLLSAKKNLGVIVSNDGYSRFWSLDNEK